MRAVVVLSAVLLVTCSEATVTRSPAAVPIATPAVTAVRTTSPAACNALAMDAAKQFVLRFNAHDLSGVAGLFAVDARTYWARRGEPVTNGFKEGGREMIRAMLEARMSDGEILAFDRIDPDPSPAIMYADGAGHFAPIPRIIGLRGTFPDGATRALGTKFVYDCAQSGIVQLLILPSG